MSLTIWDNVNYWDRKEQKMSENKSKESARSWFCVLNNPKKIFGDIEPIEMVEQALNKWCTNKPHRTCAINYEIGNSNTPHMHMVLEDPAKTRFTAIQKLFAGIHVERTKGTKAQAEDYINKRGRFEEKNHTVVIPAMYRGTIKANQGIRNDLDIIQELIEQGKTPNEIMDISIQYRNRETLIRKAYFNKRRKETPPIRKVKVIWHTGESGCGKSYTYCELCKQFGEDSVYLFTDYDSGGFDLYCGERILFMDEFKGNLRFQKLLNLTDRYKIQIHCRYANAYALWDEVHITSIYPPDEAYKFMVEPEQREHDKITQLLRRIDSLVYHYKQNNNYKQFEIETKNYTTYEALKNKAMKNMEKFRPYEQLTDEEKQQCPFD